MYYYVYVLQSQKVEDRLYVGYSENYCDRLKQHNKGEVRSSKFYRLLKLIFLEVYVNKKDVKRRERYLKTTKGRTTLRFMLKETLSKELLKVNSRVRV